MNFKQILGLAALTGLLSSGPASAYSISLETPGLAIDPDLGVVVDEGTAEFGIDLVIDAPGAPGNDPGDIHGMITVHYDPDLVRFLDFAYAGAEEFLPTQTGTDSGLATVTIDFQNAEKVSTIGTFNFSLLGGSGEKLAIKDDVLNFSVADADDFFGSIVSKDPTDVPVNGLAFNGATVSVVPIPSAVWLMLSALGLLATKLRRTQLSTSLQTQQAGAHS